MRPPAPRTALLVGLLLALGVAALTVDVPDVGVVRDQITAAGPLAPILFVAAYAVVVPAPFPKSVLSAAAGVAFGLPLGAALVLAGATTGAALAFGLARALGRDAVNRMAAGRLDRVDDVIERHGVLAALVIRFIPVMPFTVLNYACGVTVMRLRHFVAGTLVGIAPGTTVHVALGSMGAQVSLWVPVGVSVGLGLVSLLIGLNWEHLPYTKRHSQ
ncbi:MAG: hypothetical protein QG622_343 [Actinomycetota bacterium]|nr:hypothetical protein [Actinomycetota bacterium]